MIKDFKAWSDTIFTDKPIVVLVNHKTAGSSEIVAAALQDYGRGMVVGSRTYGMGTIQTISYLNDLSGLTGKDNILGAVKLVVDEYYRANGTSFQKTGVTPDILLSDGKEENASGNKFNEEREENKPYALDSVMIERSEIGAVDLSPVVKQVKLQYLQNHKIQKGKNHKERALNKAIQVVIDWLDSKEV